MKEEQLKLIPSTYNPLVERIGPEFFEELPREPGVYRMLGPEGSLLYVGKAKDLRNRLLQDYLAGRKDGFSEWPERGRKPAGTGGNFTRSLLLADAEVLSGFFERRSRFNRKMAERLEFDSHLIPQGDLDDAITRSRFR